MSQIPPALCFPPANYFATILVCHPGQESKLSLPLNCAWLFILVRMTPENGASHLIFTPVGSLPATGNHL